MFAQTLLLQRMPQCHSNAHTMGKSTWKANTFTPKIIHVTLVLVVETSMVKIFHLHLSLFHQTHIHIKLNINQLYYIITTHFQFQFKMSNLYEFLGTLNTEVCREVNCGITIHNQYELVNQCEPQYFMSEGKTEMCCPIQWSCANNNKQQEEEE